MSAPVPSVVPPPAAQPAAVLDWGRTRYEPARLAQEALVARHLAGEIGDTLVFTEHDPVFTVGLRAGAEHHLVWDAARLASEGVEVVKTNRGGDITYHGPGQLVGYPILDLDEYFTDIHRYLRTLEEVIIATLADYGLSGDRSPGETGVWLDVGTPFARKICAMGVRASRWVTMHGWAFNLNTDLRYFEYIIPCGIKDKAVTSLHRELGRSVDEAEVKERVAAHFARLFDVDLVATPADRLLGA
jgi:lipoyl(octanoyl) transferase